MGRRRAALRLRAWAQSLLADHADDRDLATAFQLLRARGFEPPRPLTLPAGDAEAVRTELETRTGAEVVRLAETILALPDPATDPAEAKRVLEVLLAAAGTDDTGAQARRAADLLERLQPTAPAPDQALWRLRLELAQLDAEARMSPERLEALVEPLRRHTDDAPERVAEGLRLIASTLLPETHAAGASWIAPALGGRRLVNVALALTRRPALATELGPIAGWLREADDLGRRGGEGLASRLDAVEEADREGRFDEASELLLAALDASGDRVDLAEAVAARAAALQDPGLAQRASTVPGLAVDLTSIASTARRTIAPPDLAPVEPPENGWSDALPALASGAPVDETQLALLEACGARARAARGWLDRGGDADLVQAARLADALGEDGRRALCEALIDRAPTDELELHDPTARALATALWELLDGDSAQTPWTWRLRATASADRPEPAEAIPAPSDDDPHSVSNRLAAAGDLVEADKHEAAAAIVQSLLKRVEDASQIARIVALTARLLRLDEPPAALVTAVAKLLHTEGPLADALAERLCEDALAAFPLHGSLQQAALDEALPDARRVELLEAWLGIWRATATPPAPDAVRDFMRQAPALLPLAAAKLAGDLDPVAVSARFLEVWPPAETAATTWADAILATSRGQGPSQP